MFKYKMDMCNDQLNNVCSWTNVTDGTAAQLKAAVIMTSMEADEINSKLKREHENAGGQYVLQTFDIGLKSNNDNMQYYSVEEGSYMPLNDSEYLDVSITGFSDRQQHWM